MVIKLINASYTWGGVTYNARILATDVRSKCSIVFAYYDPLFGREFIGTADKDGNAGHERGGKLNTNKYKHILR